MRWRLVGWIVAALGLASCECGGARSPEEEATDSVSRFFGAALLHDCDAVERELGARLLERFRSDGCDASLEGFADHPLLRIVSAHVDGRDPDAVLVRVRMADTPEDAIVRVARIDGAWKVVSL